MTKILALLLVGAVALAAFATREPEDLKAQCAEHLWQQSNHVVEEVRSLAQLRQIEQTQAFLEEHCR